MLPTLQALRHFLFLDNLTSKAGVLDGDRLLLKQHLGTHDDYRAGAADPSWRAPLLILELVEDTDFLVFLSNSCNSIE